jgi:hypothetical protein
MFGNYACPHCIQDYDVLNWPVKGVHKHAKVFIVCPGCHNTLELFACEIDTILNGEPRQRRAEVLRTEPGTLPKGYRYNLKLRIDICIRRDMEKYGLEWKNFLG